MKVIDLLNKLYNNEEVPKRIKLGVCYLTLNENKDNYIYDNSDEYYGDELIHWYDLGMKVEIIEEDKKIEKLENEKQFYSYRKYADIINDIDKILYILKGLNLTEEKIDNLNNKINEIIDKLNEMENE